MTCMKSVSVVHLFGYYQIYWSVNWHEDRFLWIILLAMTEPLVSWEKNDLENTVVVIPEDKRGLLQTEPMEGEDLERWGERASKILGNVIQLEAESVGIKPEPSMVTDWIVEKLDKKTLSKEEIEQIKAYGKLPAGKNPLLLKLLTGRKRHNELFNVNAPEDVFDVCTSTLTQKALADTLRRAEILPSNYDASKEGSQPVLCLSRQTVARLKQAKARGYFGGRISFSADVVNDFIVRESDAWVLVTPFAKLNRVGPYVGREELSFGNEKEYAWYTGVPLGAIDVVLPASLFPDRFPDFLTETENWKKATPEQRARFEANYRRRVHVPMPNEYAASLRHNYETTGQILTEKQKNILKLGKFSVEEFWKAAVLPLREFTVGKMKNKYPSHTYNWQDI